MPFDGTDLTQGQKNLLALADFMETCELGFDMAQLNPEPECGTAGCIAGHHALMTLEEEPSSGSVAEFGGLTEKQGFFLCIHPCTKRGRKIPYPKVTKSMAVGALRRAALTGEVYFVPGE